MRLQAKNILLLTLVLLVGCAAVPSSALTGSGDWVIQREFLQHRQNSSKTIEVFWTKPREPGPWPAILFIHGHQEQLRNGGEAFVRTGRLGIMASRGYVAAALSQPGYGHSDGPPDFCGPFTQDAVLVAIDFLRHQPFVNPNKVALYGYSRGAIVASMVATQDPKLAAVVLGAGAYDLFRWYPTPLRGIDANIEREAGTSGEAFRARSAIYHADKMKVPVLVLHGAQDERVPVQQAEGFAEKLQANGVAVTLKIFPNARHGIPIDDQYREIYPFLEQSLR
jgi:dipeptidyl aminopeptidase/acylaminoacyl peptidase